MDDNSLRCKTVSVLCLGFALGFLRMIKLGKFIKLWLLVLAIAGITGAGHLCRTLVLYADTGAEIISVSWIALFLVSYLAWFVILTL